MCGTKTLPRVFSYCLHSKGMTQEVAESYDYHSSKKSNQAATIPLASADH